MAEGRTNRRRKSGRKAAQSDATDMPDDDAAAPLDQPDSDAQNGAPAHASSPPSSVQQKSNQTADTSAAAGGRAARVQPKAQPDAASWPLPTWLLQAVAMALIAWATTALTGACPHAQVAPTYQRVWADVPAMMHACNATYTRHLASGRVGWHACHQQQPGQRRFCRQHRRQLACDL